MLAQVLQVQGAEVVAARHSDIATRRAVNLVPKQTNAIAVCFLNEDSAKHAGILVRRFKRLYPTIRVGAVLWAEREEDMRPSTLDEADFIASTLTSAVREALSDARPSSSVAPPRKIRVRRSLNTTNAAAAQSV
jgi:hypothetical protein